MLPFPSRQGTFATLQSDEIRFEGGNCVVQELDHAILAQASPMAMARSIRHRAGDDGDLAIQHVAFLRQMKGISLDMTERASLPCLPSWVNSLSVDLTLR